MWSVRMDNLSKVDEAIFVNTIAMQAMGIPDDDIYVIDTPLKRNMFLQEDTLIPVIAGLSNIMGEKIFGKEIYDCIFPIELEKAEESLCFVKAVPCNCDNAAPRTIQLLLAMEAIDNIFKPRLDKRMDLTSLIENWRAALQNFKEGEKIDLSKFHNELVVNNLLNLTNLNKVSHKK